MKFFFCTHDTAQFVELKNGETYNGVLVNCDSWMNVCLRDVTLTSKARV
jgi:small nuclear ribonucleoprotein (snRNP)-like protein